MGSPVTFGMVMGSRTPYAGSDVSERHGQESLRIEAFSCREIEDLSHTLGFRVAVVAAVDNTNLFINGLQQRLYASERITIPPLGVTERLFDCPCDSAWWKVPIAQSWWPNRPGIIERSVDNEDLVLTLPTNIRKKEFSEEFYNGLEELRFERLAYRSKRIDKLIRKPRTKINSRYAYKSAEDSTLVEVKNIVSIEPYVLPRIADVAFGALVRIITRAEFQKISKSGG